MLRTLLILAAALPLAACNDDNTDARRPTRIVCTEGGRTTLDDFATGGAETTGAALFWDSATQNGTVRAIGNCVSFPQARPADWRPIMPGTAAQ